MSHVCSSLTSVKAVKALKLKTVPSLQSKGGLPQLPRSLQEIRPKEATMIRGPDYFLGGKLGIGGSPLRFS